MDYLNTSELQIEKILKNFSKDRTGNLPERKYLYAEHLNKSSDIDVRSLKILRLDLEQKQEQKESFLFLLFLAGFVSVFLLNSLSTISFFTYFKGLFLVLFLGLVLKVIFDLKKILAWLHILKVAIAYKEEGV